MAVVQTGVILRFIGLSGDAKPSPTAGQAGSKFYETDTGTTYVWDGSAWSADLSSAQLARAIKSVTFDGTAGKGALGAVPFFTVTGRVFVENIVGFVTTAITEDGGTGVSSLELGVVGATTLFIPAAVSSLFLINRFWQDATPAQFGEVAPAATKEVATDQNIQANVTSTGTRKVNGGVIQLTVLWTPLSAGALVV